MEQAKETIEPAAEASGSYAWAPPGKPLAVHLDFGVVDRLLAEVMRGFAAVPRRGAEVGGILLGTVDRKGKPVIRIEDFEPVACEYARGPSYLLSTADEAKFLEAIQRCQSGGDRKIYPVGYFRSHTRDGLAPGAEDLTLFDRCFPSDYSVALLVKPYATRVSVAGFFFRENGKMQTEASCLEFPFRRAELGGGASTPRKRTEPARQAKQSPPPAAAPVEPDELPAASPLPPFLAAAEPQPAPKRRKRWVWLPLSFIFLLLGFVMGFQIALSVRPPTPMPGSEPYALELTVVPAGESLHLKWNRRAPAIQNAQLGTLRITDGAETKTLQMEASQLRTGSVIYRRLAGEVTFRLEVVANDRYTISETLEFRAVAPAGP